MWFPKPIPLVLGLVGLLIPSYAQEEPVFGGELWFGRGADSVTLDPALSEDGESTKVIGQIFDGLVRYKADSTEVEPALARSWKVSSDDREWVFELRRDVRFHDGTPFNADAVVFSFMRQMDAKHIYYLPATPYEGITFVHVSKVEALGPYRLRIVLDRPYAPFLYNLAMPSAMIVSPTAVAADPDGFASHPVGTGAFKMDKWVKGKTITLVANEQYWEGIPYLDRLVFASIPNNSKRFFEFKAGLIHVMDGISPIDVKRVRKLTGGRITVRAGMNVGYLAMNMEKPPFDNLLVRRAVNHAIDKDRLVRLHYQGFAVPAINPIPPSMWSYHDGLEGYVHDPQRAKELLGEAGFPDGFKTTLWTMNVPRPYLPQPVEVAEAIRNDLAQVGIEVVVEQYEWSRYLKMLDNGEHVLCLSGWVGDNGDPDNFLWVLFDKANAVKPNANNLAFIKDEDLHQLLVKAQSNSNRRERTRIYRRVQEMIHDRAPWTPLAHVQQIYAFQPSVQGLVLHPTDINRFHRVWLK